MTTDWSSYVVPTLAALLLHALVVVFFFGGWSFEKRSPATIEPKVVKASLVTFKKTPPKKVVKKVKTPSAKSVEKKPSKSEPKKVVEKPKKNATKVQSNDSRLDALNQLVSDEDESLQREQLRELAERDAELLAQYSAQMRAAITNNWSRPPSARQDMVVVLVIQLVPTGDVISVEVIESSGNAAVDRSAIKAVEKVGRFSMLQGMPSLLFEHSFRKTRLKFKPIDLRL